MDKRDILNKKFKQKYQGKKVLLSSGHNGTCIQWSKGSVEDVAKLDKIKVKVKNTVYIVSTSLIVGVEDEL